MLTIGVAKFYANFCPFGTRALSTYDLHVFSSRAARDEWVSSDASDLADGQREPVTYEDARRHARGAIESRKPSVRMGHSALGCICTPACTRREGAYSLLARASPASTGA